jgi:exodeoxyribonuclease-3
MTLTPLCWISKAHYIFRRQYLDHAELKRDVLRIKVFYWKRGFRETEVDTVVTDKGKDKVAVAFNIVEGPPTIVSALDVIQTQPALTDAEMKKRIVLGTGTPLNLLRLDTTVVLLEQSLWNKGYADAVVDTVITLDSASRSGAIKINIDPKYKATIGEILIEGNSKVSQKTLRKSLTMQPGQLFRRAELLKSQRALYESNLFRRASIEVPKQGDSSKVIVVTVQEAPLRDARISAGFNNPFYDSEGRVLEMEFEKFILVNVYFPNGGRGPERVKYKLDFYAELFERMEELRKRQKNIVVCGDYNTAHKEIDLARPKENARTSGFLPEERAWLDKIISMDYVDIFREYNKEPNQYTYWDQITRARERNVGWRIDYFMVSKEARGLVTNATVHPEVMGSDHCPIGLELKL